MSMPPVGTLPIFRRRRAGHAILSRGYALPEIYKRPKEKTLAVLSLGIEGSSTRAILRFIGQKMELLCLRAAMLTTDSNGTFATGTE